jgi:uncharacterized protein with HEPN domain
VKPLERDYTFYLKDMLVGIEKIDQYTSQTPDYQTLEEDMMKFDAVIRNLEIIGEAAKNIPQYIKLQHPEIPWEDMYRTRNIVTHHYFGIDASIIWQIVKVHLPENKKQISELINKLEMK